MNVKLAYANSEEDFLSPKKDRKRKIIHNKELLKVRHITPMTWAQSDMIEGFARGANVVQQAQRELVKALLLRTLR